MEQEIVTTLETKNVKKTSNMCVCGHGWNEHVSGEYECKHEDGLGDCNCQVFDDAAQYPTVEEKPGEFTWMLLGGFGGAVLIMLVIVGIIQVAKSMALIGAF